MRSAIVLLGVALTGCGSSIARERDIERADAGSADVAETARDAAVASDSTAVGDAAETDAAETDTAETDTTDADAADADALACSPFPETQSCPYTGYGSQCWIACTPASCRFTLTVRWSGGGYCCGSGVETWSECRCVDGFVECQSPSGTSGRPTTYCEFCSRDAGS